MLVTGLTVKGFGVVTKGDILTEAQMGELPLSLKEQKAHFKGGKIKYVLIGSPEESVIRDVLEGTMSDEDIISAVQSDIPGAPTVSDADTRLNDGVPEHHQHNEEDGLDKEEAKARKKIAKAKKTKKTKKLKS